MNIAIDGPAGAGKSTIARIVASKLGFIYVDTGAMYRTIGLYALNNPIDMNDESQIAQLAGRAEVSLGYDGGVQRVYLNGEDVSDRIRTEEVSAAASIVAKSGPVRSALTATQKHIAATSDVVMDGRDIGSAVLPDAELKIYLTASTQVRARRRAAELAARGEEADIATIEQDIIDRDYADMHREISPLVCTPDAIEIDSSDMTIEEVTERIIALAQEKMGQNE